MRILVLPATIIAILAFASEAFPQEVKLKEVPITWRQAASQDGMELYADLCAVCHGNDAKGNGPAAPALSSKNLDLTRLALDNEGVFPVEEVKNTIRGEADISAHGSREMPMWGVAFRDVRLDFKRARLHGFVETRIDALADYLEFLQAE
jgi:mono/diheme cytochrome c family protein